MNDDKIQFPEIKNSQLVFDKFIKIHCDTLLFNNGHLYDYYRLTTKADAVNILAMTSEGQLVLTREYRHPTKKVLLGCPGGFIDNNETPLEAAQRELLEETGYTASSFEVIGHAFPCPGLTSQSITFIKATNAISMAKPNLDKSELLETVLKSEKELMELCTQGIALDGILCTALFFLKTCRCR